MTKLIDICRLTLPFVIGIAVWFLGCGPVWSAGLFLLTGAACFPVGKAKEALPSVNPAAGLVCPENIRKWVYPVILASGLIVCFFSALQNSRDPRSWKNDWICLDLQNKEEIAYTRKVKRTESEVKIYGNFNEESMVETDGRALKRTLDKQKFLSDPETYYFDGVTYILVSAKAKQLTAITPRKIVDFLARPYWLFALLLAVCLWSSLCDFGLLPESASPVKNSGRLLLTALAVMSVSFIFWMYGQLLPLKYTVDGPHYLSFTAGNPIALTLTTYRTPGYPLLLKAVTYISPMSHNALIVIQYGLYFLSLSWLLYELYRAGCPSAGCLILQMIFSRYLWTFQNFMLADSPGLSGIILLLAFSAAFYRKLSAGCSRLQVVCWYIGGVLLVFAQLMIKPFPGTIFIPGGMFFLMFLFHRKPARGFRHAICFSAAALILPLLFCSYRYWKTGDFNFASLISSSICANAIILHDPAKLDQLPPETRKNVDCIVKETLKAHPELKWPINLDAPGFDCQNGYTEYYWDIMYLPGIKNSSWFQERKGGNRISYDVDLELECKKMVPALVRCIDRQKVVKLQKSYLQKLGSYLVYPPLTVKKFHKYSPFGKRVSGLLLIILSLALYLGRRQRAGCCKTRLPEYNGELMFLLAVMAFLGVAGIFSTLVAFIVPVIEIRREVVGLFSVFFGAFAMLIYSSWYLAICLLNRIFRRTPR